MPTPTKYTFSISVDTAQGAMNSDSLGIEIQAADISIALQEINTDGDNIEIWFKDSLSSEQQSTLAAVVAAHQGEPPVGNVIEYVRQVMDATGRSVWLTTHDYCAPESWWQKGVMVTDEVLAQASFLSLAAGLAWKTQDYGSTDIPLYGDGSVPKIPICMDHKLVLNEKDIVSHPDSADPWDLTRWHPSGHFLVPVLKDYQGNTLTKVGPGESPGPGEWRVYDAENGLVQTGDNWLLNPPMMSYNYATTSEYEIVPKSGKYIKVGFAEVNSRNADWDSNTFWFDLTAANHAALLARRMYQSESDIIAASVGSPGTWRDWDILQWPYDQSGSPIEDVRIPVLSSAAMALRLQVPEHTPYSKYDQSPSGRKPKVIVTIYAVSFDEVAA